MKGDKQQQGNKHERWKKRDRDEIPQSGTPIYTAVKNNPARKQAKYWIPMRAYFPENSVKRRKILQA